MSQEFENNNEAYDEDVLETSSTSSQKSPSIWTPANIVTCIRIVFVPIWVAFALSIGVTSPLLRAK